MQIHAREGKISKDEQMIKSQNDDFRFEKVKFWILTFDQMTILPFE